MSDDIQSFEVTMGGASGDMLSARSGDRELKVGVLACAYFEYWRMYDGLLEDVTSDMKSVAERIGKSHEVVYPGLVDTLDKADAAGQLFKEQHIDVLVITEGTYCTDYIVHQALLHLPGDMPLCIYASQAHGVLDYEAGYAPVAPQLRADGVDPAHRGLPQDGHARRLRSRGGHHR